MKAPIARLSLACLLAVPAVFAQDEPRRTGRLPITGGLGKQNFTPDVPGVRPAAKTDDKVLPATSVVPEPTPPDQIKPATIALPNGPIEPWLLTKDAGPFMVMARTFRGPEAERFALALAMELRRDYGLPAYILRTKDFPNRSFMRNVPPTAPPGLDRAHLGDPERVRSYDEAVVLVGNEKTLADSEALLHRVKKIKPKCLDGIPTIFGWRSGLKTALRTTNPYVPTQNLFPGRGRRDHLLSVMNAGPRSVDHCPGRYSLPVADFSGRATFNPDQKNFGLFGNDSLRKSPLATAHENAEKLADALARDPDVQRTGYQPYVYHDRTSSKVLLGSFNTPNDPAAARLRVTMIQSAVEIAKRIKMGVVLAPGNALVDLEDPNQPIKARPGK